MGIVWAAPLYGVRLIERCNMTEAFRAFLLAPYMPSNTGVILGVSEEEARAASERIERMSAHCRIVNHTDGFRTEDEYRRFLEECGDVDFVFIGMSTPRTEYVCALAAELKPRAVVWGVGAGTIRILAGTMREAPPAWRRSGFQWLHRLIQDPRHLWKRYTIGHAVFLWRILRGRWSQKG